jgi:hypothetical protein
MRLASLILHLHIFLAVDISNPAAALRDTRLALKDIHRATGITFTLDYETIDPLPYENQGIYFEASPHYFLREFSRFNSPGKRSLFLFLVKPQKDAGSFDIPNGAAALCGSEAYATVVSGPIALNAPDRSETTNRYTIEHELLHVLGAQHTKRVSVMIPGNFAYISSIQPRLSILPITLRQVMKCLGKEKPR